MIDPARVRFHVDAPVPFHAVEGALQLSGWCFDEGSATPTCARIVVGGQVFPCESALTRPDAGAAFPLFPQAMTSGFALRHWLPAGYHEAHFEMSTNDVDWRRVRSLPFCGEIAPLLARIDEPASDSVEEGPVAITGWALHPQEQIEELTLHFRGGSVRCEYGARHPDAAREFGSIAHAEHTGFRCSVRLPAGPGPLQLAARLRSGRIVHLGVKRLTVKRNSNTETLLQPINARRAARIRFSRCEVPRVSIIIAVHNQLEVTLACLASILQNTAQTRYEVIIVDDCSEEPTRRALRTIAGVRVLRNNTNLGFLLSSNKGAAEARGEFLLFLNNDTEVGADWLERMLAVFDQRTDAGIVGAKLIYPDGTLQEAGAIVWRDATGMNYGKHDHADKPEYNYLREVDYCSGACILIRKRLFNQLGGFDARYAPAYYEDTDLAFAVREAGLKVYYQPRAVITHHEGQSSGRSTAGGVKAHQLVNAIKFRTKWQAALSRQFAGELANVTLARERGRPKRALVFDSRVPTPDQDAGSVRMMNLLAILQELGFRITFAPRATERTSHTERLQNAGVECLYDPHFRGAERLLAERGTEFDLIIVSRAPVAHDILPLCEKHAPGTPVIFDTVDLHFLRMQREAALAGDPQLNRKAAEMREIELGVASRASAVVVVSSYEKQILEPELPEGHVAILSNIHGVAANIAPFAGRRDCMFIGGFEHRPNTDAMLWFCAEIMPLVCAELPEAKLHIIGSNMPESVRALASANVITHGHVENVGPFFVSSVLSVAPLRYGAGVKGKINHSMSHGLPVVTTSIGAEGMHLVHGENVLIADDPADFAREVVRLSRDESLWNKLSENGKANIHEHFSFAAAKRNLRDLLQRLVSPAPENSGR